MLYGIAAVLLGLAAVLYGAAALLKALGVRVKEPEHVLSPEEKEALRASIDASKAYAEAVGNLTLFGNNTRGDA